MYPAHVIIDQSALRYKADQVNPELCDLRSPTMSRACACIKYRRSDGTEIPLKIRRTEPSADKFVFLGSSDFEDLLHQEMSCISIP